MFTQLITHVERTREAFLAIKNDVFNLFSQIQGINGRLTVIADKLIQIENRLELLEAKKGEFVVTPGVQRITNPLTKQSPSTIQTPHYVVNTASHKIHQESCVFARQIIPENRQEITWGLAAQEGFDPCVCLG